jgi:hypothetical protein
LGAHISNRRPVNDFNGSFDAPSAISASAISAKKRQGHDANGYRGYCSDCGCSHHVAVGIFFGRAIDRCPTAVGRTPPNASHWVWLLELGRRGFARVAFALSAFDQLKNPLSIEKSAPSRVSG